jgi:predicted RNase H-like HicB family nuclease
MAIEPGTDRTAWGVAVPDLPGCFSAGDTLDEALDNAHKAAEASIDASAKARGESRSGTIARLALEADA